MGLIYVNLKNVQPKKKKSGKKKEVKKAGKYKVSFRERKVKEYNPPRGQQTYLPSLQSKQTEGYLLPKYEGEMLEREQKAQKEIERKKKMTAPHYSKGPYQYTGDLPPEIIRNLGKKV